jgi:hypothetical protein
MCYLAGGFLMVIVCDCGFSGYVSLLWFEIDCMGPGVGDFLHDMDDGLDDGLDDFSIDSSPCCILVEQRKSEKQMSIQ